MHDIQSQAELKLVVEPNESSHNGWGPIPNHNDDLLPAFVGLVASGAYAMQGASLIFDVVIGLVVLVSPLMEVKTILITFQTPWHFANFEGLLILGAAKDTLLFGNSKYALYLNHMSKKIRLRYFH